MSITTKVSKKYQIVIPKKIREIVGISEGDELVINAEMNRIVIKVRPKSYTDKLRGLHKDIWKGIDPIKYVKKERDSWG